MKFCLLIGGSYKIYELYRSERNSFISFLSLPSSNILRCMVCQNQNLAESEAPLAVDMKQKIREMLEAGKDKNEIKQFLSERYSSYILY